MVITVPIGRRRRVTVSYSRRIGMTVVGWRNDDAPPEDSPFDDGPGVREPRRPIRPLRGGAVALPLDDEL